MFEIRADDLRFTLEEAQSLLAELGAPMLSPEDIQVLNARAEGWVVGLKMAMLSLKSEKDIPGFISSFTGSQRYIMDYLIEEVLQRQSKEVYNFLLLTSVLERLSGTHIYKGIPYAAPPVGDLRWRPPQPPAPWTGVRECTAFSIPAPQINPFAPVTFEQSEDCLYLNVMTPAKKASDKLPVMVWLHEGGYSFSHGNQPYANLPGLPQHGVLLVTVNMRLAVIGMLAHTLLSKESPNSVSGNYMFLDMIAALKWVQKNIAAFGGDPANVTIFGESGGSAKVSVLMASPLARGLFHKAVLESGTATDKFFPGMPLKDMEALGEEFFTELGVDKAADPLKAARALPWEEVIKAGAAFGGKLFMEKGYAVIPDAAVDGWFLTDKPANIFKAGTQNPVPFITVAKLGEITGPGHPMLLFPILIPGYTSMLANAGKAGVKGYAAIFEHVPGNWKAESGVTTHFMEVPYVFGDMDPVSDSWKTVFTVVGFTGVKPSDPGLTEADKKLSENIMAMWTQFAKTGNPSAPGLVEWPAYDAASDQYLCLDEPLAVKSGFSLIAPKATTPTPTPTPSPTLTDKTYFDVNGTMELTDKVYDSEPVLENDQYALNGVEIFEVHGTIEGNFTRKFSRTIGAKNGVYISQGEWSFTGTVDGKHGSFTASEIGSGQFYTKIIGTITLHCKIISGSGELAKLQGNITVKMDVSDKGTDRSYNGRLTYLE